MALLTTSNDLFNNASQGAPVNYPLNKQQFCVKHQMVTEAASPLPDYL